MLHGALHRPATHTQARPAPPGLPAPPFPPAAAAAGTLRCCAGIEWPEVTFSGPAVVGLSAVFGEHIEECQRHWQTVTAATGCHLWRVDCAELLSRLSRHAEVLQKLADSYLQVQ